MTIPKIEFKFNPNQFELKEEGDAAIIEGYASVFGNEDSYKDVVAAGAFKGSLNKKDDIRMLWQHDFKMPIGVWEVLHEDKKGLFGRGKLANTTMGRDAYALAKIRAVKGLSIGYKVIDYEIDKKSGVRVLKTLDLMEISLVTFPANEKAEIVSVKNINDLALTAISDGFKSLLQQCQDGMEIEEENLRAVVNRNIKILTANGHNRNKRTA